MRSWEMGGALFVALAGLACGPGGLGDGADASGDEIGGDSDTAAGESGGSEGPGDSSEGPGDTLGEADSEDTSVEDLPPSDPPNSCISLASADGPEPLWLHIEPGAGRWRGVVVGPDGAAYVSGEAQRQIVAFDAAGEELWSKADEADDAQGIAWSAGRVVVGGSSVYAADDHPDWLRVYSPAGELVDELIDELGDDAFWDLAAGPSGELFAGGRHHAGPLNLRVAMYSPELELLWTHSKAMDGGSGGSSSPQVAFDGLGRPLAAFRFVPPETRQVLRFGPDGEVEWIADLVSDAFPSEAWPSAIAADGRLFAGGRATSQAWVGELDEAGLPLWIATFGDQTWDSVHSILPVPGGVVLAGQLSGGAPGCSQCRDAWLTALDAGGQPSWTVLADGSAGRNDSINDLALAPNGDLVVVGQVQCDAPDSPIRNTFQPFAARLRPR